MDFLNNMVKSSNALLKDKLQNPFNQSSKQNLSESDEKDLVQESGIVPSSSSAADSQSANPEIIDDQPRPSIGGDSQFASIAADAEAVKKKAVDGAKNIGTFLFSMANKAGRQVTETAKQVKKVVENTNIMTDLTKAQQEFIKEHGGNVEPGELPWMCYGDDEVKANEMKEQILSLSQDKRNFVRSPPNDSNFDYNPASSYPIALSLLKEDPNLGKMRYELVPKIVNEDNFWRNYFYRVSLLKQFVDRGDNLAKHDWLSSRSSSGEGPDEITVNDESVTQNINSAARGNNNIIESQHDESQLKKQDSQGTATLTNQIGGFDNSAELDDSSKLLAEADDLNSKLKELNISFDDYGTQDGEEEKWEKELQKDLQEFELISNDLSTLTDEESLAKEIMEMKKKSLSKSKTSNK